MALDIDHVDKEFLERCFNNDEDAWKELFTAGYKIAWFTARAEPFRFSESLCDDIAQDTMVVLCLKIKKVRNIRAFIVRVAHNKCVDILRKEKTVSLDDGNNYKDVKVPSPLPDAMDDHKVLEELKRLIRNISEPCSSYLEYRYFFELSYKEIAKRMCIKVNEVGVYIARCLTVLRRMLRMKRQVLEEMWRIFSPYDC